MPGGVGPGATPLRTPRDHFALNREGEGQLVGSTPRDIKMHEKFTRQQMRSKLSSLPRPKETEWELEELPSESAEPMAAVEFTEEDSAERDRREQEARALAAQAEFKRQSQVYQRGLPRPAVLDLSALMKRASHVTDPIGGLIAQEAAILIAHDSLKHPVPGSKVEGKAPKLGRLDDRFVDAAHAAIAAEIASTDAQQQQEEWQAKFDDSWSSVRVNALPGLENYEDEEDPFQEEQRMIGAFDNVQASLLATAERGNKLEKKLALHYGGYQNRAKTLRSKILEASTALPKAQDDLDSFRTLQISEEAAISRRMEKLRDQVSFVMRREREAQEVYKSRKDELDELVAGTAVVNGWH
jgi:pre-mRNA-splicing factor CDC5/CEF1